VFLALGSIGDALPLAIVAAEAASQLLKLHPEAQASVIVLTHAQHTQRLKTLVVLRNLLLRCFTPIFGVSDDTSQHYMYFLQVGLERVQCIALDLDIFPAAAQGSVPTVGTRRHRDGSLVQTSASTQVALHRNRIGFSKDSAAMASTELDSIVAACQRVGLGSSGDNKGAEEGALIVNLFAAHALMVRL
jgi:hypothetical protein